MSELNNTNANRLAMLESLTGIIPDTGQTKESIREERLEEKCGSTYMRALRKAIQEADEGKLTAHELIED